MRKKLTFVGPFFLLNYHSAECPRPDLLAQLEPLPGELGLLKDIYSIL